VSACPLSARRAAIARDATIPVSRAVAGAGRRLYAATVSDNLLIVAMIESPAASPRFEQIARPRSTESHEFIRARRRPGGNRGHERD